MSLWQVVYTDGARGAEGAAAVPEVDDDVATGIGGIH